MVFKRSHGICPNPSVVAVKRTVIAEIVIFNIALSSKFSVKIGILIYPMKTPVQQIETRLPDVIQSRELADSGLLIVPDLIRDVASFNTLRVVSTLLGRVETLLDPMVHV